MNTTSLPSLFIASLPRSLSTQVFHICRNALSLEAPAWTTDGEILNNDRHVLSGQAPQGESVKYSLPGCARSPLGGFDAIQAYLSDAVRARGYCYKDVVQPFAVRRWLEHNQADMPDRRLAVLCILPDIPHVALRMMSKKWWYPGQVAPPHLPPVERLLHGLHQAKAVLEALPGEKIRFCDIINSEAPLADALRRLYPNGAMPQLNYIGEDFERKRAHVMMSRTSRGYAMLAEAYDALCRTTHQ